MNPAPKPDCDEPCGEDGITPFGNSDDVIVPLLLFLEPMPVFIGESSVCGGEYITGGGVGGLDG